MELKDLGPKIAKLESSINIDKRMYDEDIEAQLAHVTMLGQCGIIDKTEADKICNELEKIQKEFSYGNFNFDTKYRNINEFIKAELFKRLGDLGNKALLARHYDDQIALDLRLNLKKEADIMVLKLKELINAICYKAAEHTKTIMPGYAHLQAIQPTTFAHHIMAYAEMFLRDIERLNDSKKRMEEMPLGSGILSTTSYPINRSVTTLLLGLEKMTNNSVDAVSDRDFCVEMASCLSLIMLHLSRFCEEIILLSSSRFRFIELDDNFSYSSNILHQRKSPNVAERIRGKSGRVFGNLVSILTSLKALPLSHSDDMKETEESLFDSIDTVALCVDIFTPMISSMKVNEDIMKEAAKKSFVNMQDCADYLIKKGTSQRDAYMIVSHLVNYCIENNCTLEELPLERYKQASSKFEDDILDVVSLENCIEERNTFSGPAEFNVLQQIKRVKSLI